MEKGFLQGVNEDIKYKGIVFHIQTEDMGKETALMVSTIFYKGRVVIRDEIDYSNMLSEEVTKEKLGNIMKELHKKMKTELLKGCYDERIKVILPTKESLKNMVEEEMIKFFQKKIIPDLKDGLGIEFSEKDKAELINQIKMLKEDELKERFLSVCKLVFLKIKDRCEPNKYKELVKQWVSNTGK